MLVGRVIKWLTTQNPMPTSWEEDSVIAMIVKTLYFIFPTKTNLFPINLNQSQSQSFHGYPTVTSLASYGHINGHKSYLKYLLNKHNVLRFVSGQKHCVSMLDRRWILLNLQESASQVEPSVVVTNLRCLQNIKKRNFKNMFLPFSDIFSSVFFFCPNRKKRQEVNN